MASFKKLTVLCITWGGEVIYSERQPGDMYVALWPKYPDA